MGVGKPVIATGYSGNLEFMDDQTAYLVEHDLAPVGPGSAPYPPESRWAQPRIAHAAELMRRVVAHPAEAQERGRRAAERIHREFSVTARSAALARMVEEARRRPAGRGSWRRFFMEGWRAGRDRIEEVPYGALDWLPDGTPVDATMRRLLMEHREGATAPNPEAGVDRFYQWLNELVFPLGAPAVSRYLYELWCERPDLQQHFPSLDPDPLPFLRWLTDHGRDDTEIPYQLLPSEDDLLILTRQQERRQRRDRIVRAVRMAGHHAASLVTRRPS
jgi:hypothetical protein